MWGKLLFYQSTKEMKPKDFHLFFYTYQVNTQNTTSITIINLGTKQPLKLPHNPKIKIQNDTTRDRRRPS